MSYVTDGLGWIGEHSKPPNLYDESKLSPEQKALIELYENSIPKDAGKPNFKK